MGNELCNAWLVRDRYNELITRLRSLAGSMHRTKTEKITTGLKRRRIKNNVRVYKELENRSADFLVE